MSIRPIALLAAAALAGGLARAAEKAPYAEPGRAATSPAAWNRNLADEMPAFSLLDKNHNGSISPKEFGRHRGEAFRVFDANGDGAISPEEYRQGGERRDVLADMAAAYLLRWDENENGLIEKREFHGRPAAFAEADSDEDNVLQHKELLALLSSGKPIQYSPRQFFDAHDLDGDGLIVHSEWQKTEDRPDLFFAIDANADAAISYAEAQYFLFRYERRLWPVETLSQIREKKERALKEASAKAAAPKIRQKDFVSTAD